MSANRRASVGGERDAGEKAAREVWGGGNAGWRDGVKTNRDIYIDTASRGGVTSFTVTFFVTIDMTEK